MSKDDKTKEDHIKDGGGEMAEISDGMNTKAGMKLIDALAGLVGIPRTIVDLVAGAERIRAVEQAKADGKVMRTEAEANGKIIEAQVEFDCLRIESGEYVFDREMHKTKNRRAIVVEAQKALPPFDEEVSDEPVSGDFVHTFFDEFDGISDPEIHKIAGRLLAGEITRPGSFPRRTMRVLKDLESSEFKLFATLCRFLWNVAGPQPLVFDVGDKIYARHGLTFMALQELDSLGLISYGGIGGYRIKELSQGIAVGYGLNTVLEIQVKDGGDLSIGKVMLTDAGKRLSPLTNAELVPEFTEYIIKKWHVDGHKISLNGKLLDDQNEDKPESSQDMEQQ